MTADLVVVSRAAVARVLELAESSAASSPADAMVRAELHRWLLSRPSAAALVGAMLADRDTRAGRPQTSDADGGGVGRLPFGDELTTEQAAGRLGISARQVRRRCRFDAGHADRLRSRLSRGVLVVSGFDVDACRSGS